MSFVRDVRWARIVLAVACAFIVGLMSAVPASAAQEGGKKDRDDRRAEKSADDEDGKKDKNGGKSKKDKARKKKDKRRRYRLEEGPCDIDKLPKRAVHQWTPAGESIVHKVGYGQGLQGIAHKYGITGKEAYRVLWDANPQLEQLHLERSGITIRIPTCGTELRRRKLPKPPPSPEPEEDEEQSTQSETPDEPAGDSGGGGGGGSDAPAVADGSVWDKLAECESGGNWSINTGNGYYGGLQFSESSWKAVGGTGLPHQHSREEQIKRGKILQSQQGWGAWPACSAKLGLR